MKEFIQFTTIPAITVAVFLLAECIKAIFPDIKRALPAICGFSGMVIAVICKLVAPVAVQGDILTAIATGIASGFAATGVHQLGNLFSGSAAKENGQGHNESGEE